MVHYRPRRHLRDWPGLQKRKVRIEKCTYTLFFSLLLLLLLLLPIVLTLDLSSSSSRCIFSLVRVRLEAVR